PSVDIPREKALDTFTQELLPVLAIRSKARLHRFLEFSRQRHLTSLVPCASCSPPIARARQRCPCPVASSSRQQAGSRWCCHTCRNRPDIQARNRCVLEHASADALDVREIPQLQPPKCGRHFRCCGSVETSKPGRKRARTCAIEVFENRQDSYGNTKVTIVERGSWRAGGNVADESRLVP